MYQIIGYGIANTWRSNRDDVQRAFGSFGELRDPEALGKQPLRLDIVTLPRAMTVQQFAESYPSEVSVDRLVLLNQLGVGATIPAGTKVKRVVQ